MNKARFPFISNHYDRLATCSTLIQKLWELNNDFKVKHFFILGCGLPRVLASLRPTNPTQMHGRRKTRAQW